MVTQLENMLQHCWQADEGTSGRVDAAAERLQQVASLKEGTGEELVALFVAIMRSVGLLARTVRCAALSVLAIKHDPCWHTIVI